MFIVACQHEGRTHHLTCRHGAEDHGDGHVVLVREEMPQIMFDKDSPPTEVKEYGRHHEPDHPSVLDQ